eukprot:m.124567 g.124567  ORF g.124567 m.124567 type:complete len:254 (-) comp22083_c0_seq1:93-854(-)
MEPDRKRARADTGASAAVSDVSPASVGAATSGATSGATPDAAAAASGLETQLSQLQEVQTQLDQLEEERSAAILEIQRKTAEIQRPLYHERNVVAAQIDSFWLTAMLGTAQLAAVITQADEGALEHCTSLAVVDEQERGGWSVALTFSPNPYFTESELTKSCSVADDGTVSYTLPDIHWLPDKDLTTAEGGSFFEWFGEAPGVQGDVGEDGEAAAAREDELAEGDWIGDVLVRTLWPGAVDSYLSGLSDAAAE